MNKNEFESKENVVESLIQAVPAEEMCAVAGTVSVRVLETGVRLPDKPKIKFNFNPVES